MFTTFSKKIERPLDQKFVNICVTTGIPHLYIER